MLKDACEEEGVDVGDLENSRHDEGAGDQHHARVGEAGEGGCRVEDA